MILPAVTPWQPYASLVAIGAKQWETRTKLPPQKLIGKRIAIHAALRPPAVTKMSEAFLARCVSRLGTSVAWLPLGVVVCTCYLFCAVPTELVVYAGEEDDFGDYSPGRWAWKLTDVRPVPDVPAKGSQVKGWPWRVPAELEREVT